MITDVCKKYNNNATCYVNYTLRTWSVLTILTLIALYFLNVDKKLMHIFICVLMLNSILGSLLLNVLVREKILEIFGISYPILLLFDAVIHILPFLLIYTYYTPPKLSANEIISGILLISALFLIYDKVIGLKNVYISISIIKPPTEFAIGLYLFLYSGVMYFYK